MRVSLKWPALLCGGALILGMAFPWPFSGAASLGEIEAQIANAAGFRSRISGGMTFALLPAPHVKLRNVAFTDALGVAKMEAPIVKGNLRLLPLVAGRIEIAGLVLHNPSIILDTTASSQAPAEANPKPGSIPVQPDPARFGTIEITNGTARVRTGPAPEQHAEITGIDLILDWRGRNTPSALSGRANWRGQPFDLSALLGKPAELLGGKMSPFTLDIKTRLGALSLDGDLSGAPRWQFAGKIKSSSPDATALQELFRLDFPLLARIGRTSLTGDARIHATSFAISPMTLDITGNIFTGALRIQSGAGKPDVTATLAAQSIVFDPRTGFPPGMVADSDNNWSHESLRLGFLSRMNMDLRLSTADLRFGKMSFSDVAISTLAKDGRFEFSLSSGKSYNGTIKARLSLNGNLQTPQLRTLLQFDKIDSAAFLRDADGSPRLGGIATGEWEIRSNGESFHEFVRHSHGNLRARLTDGVINGIDIDNALRQAQRQPLTLAGELRNGRTLFKSARVNASIEAGILSLSDSSSESENFNIVYTGTASLLARTMDFDLDATRRSPATSAAQANVEFVRKPAHLRLDISGPWSNPVIRLDPESLINNSESAAPLLRSQMRTGSAPIEPAKAKPE